MNLAQEMHCIHMLDKKEADLSESILVLLRADQVITGVSVLLPDVHEFHF